MAFVRSLRRCGEKVPDIFMQFGLEQQFRFVSHPGVFAVSKILEMRTISQMRANFTEENIEKIKGFDPDLARKAQIAYDNKLPVNFQQLELIEDILPRLLDEKKQLGAARESAAKLPAGGPYELPKSVDVSACRPIPGQKDIQGTLMELPEAKYPGLTAKVVPGIAQVQQIAGGSSGTAPVKKE
eukprot:CAMPEP_0197656726 /NCGR_PEP_ID=MMETSP1338-20131121/43088_1 /TAXON_ID=43686 ORGANISM="Pelagodinium beii, Strain RCC1491" /NCGR_SAMPLE_ID=MMETSP1338 /ASSEMBLY_ACC=CAM_ASM_000754 /LENGTH=183 /DNA_ID=CAMNT_0043232857 /DNA_START=63 /DNA_END=614 /DNA_ORIENTATION=+